MTDKQRFHGVDVRMRRFPRSSRSKRSARPSRIVLWIVIIGVVFLCITFLLLPLLPRPFGHPSDHPHMKQNTQQGSSDEDAFRAFAAQFQHHPLPRHMIRNLSAYGLTRLVAIGDLHGDLSQTSAMLSVSRCIDNQSLSWIARNTLLIQTGDIADRGEHSIEVYRLMLRLRREAAQQHSMVLNLLGNHETMEMMRDYTYANAKERERYGADEWEHLWSVHNSEIGHFLRNAPVVLVLGNTLFCHAGLRASTLRAFEGDAESVNAYARRWLTEEPIADQEEERKRVLVSQNDGPLWTRAFEPRLYLVEHGLLS